MAVNLTATMDITAYYCQHGSQHDVMGYNIKDSKDCPYTIEVIIPNPSTNTFPIPCHIPIEMRFLER